ncbi:MAG: formylglycine-generating enzyme family protein [Bacteroidia bacterium]
MSKKSIGLLLIWVGCYFSTFAQLLDVHKLEKQFAKINDTLYAEKFEVSNAEYRTFLNAIRVSNPDAYKVALLDTSAWEEFRGMKELAYNYHSHKGYDDYPVVNLTLTAARYYCKWLTDVYNATPQEKRKFKKVVFRLPTEEEWQDAARGAPLDTSNFFQFYAWKGLEVTDRQGNFLCNFRDISVKNKEVNSDHLIIAGPVKSFKPNKYGLYNICGNVSEMIDMEGINDLKDKEWFGVTKGGGWYSPREAIKIKSRETYFNPAPHIGLRVFMIVKP